MTFEPLATGSRLDRFVLETQIGSGGQGEVWKAYDYAIQRNVALKIMPRNAAGPMETSSRLERARREASVLGRLQHPSLVRCRAFVEDYDKGVLLLALDWIEGTSLSVAVGDPRLSRPLREILLAHVADVLAYLHGAGVVHRDLKPDNIVVDQRFWSSPQDPTTIQVVDLGIAAPSRPSRAITEVGRVIGTLPFISPERLDPTQWDTPASSPSADVFAFGVLGWILLTGNHPAGLQEHATLNDYVVVYRAAAEFGGSWTRESLAGSWGDVLRACLAIPLHERLRDGAAILQMLKSAGAAEPGAPISSEMLPSSRTRRGTEILPPVPSSRPAQPSETGTRAHQPPASPPTSTRFHEPPIAAPPMSSWTDAPPRPAVALAHVAQALAGPRTTPISSAVVPSVYSHQPTNIQVALGGTSTGAGVGLAPQSSAFPYWVVLAGGIVVAIVIALFGVALVVIALATR